MTNPTSPLPMLYLGDTSLGTVTNFDLRRVEGTETFEHETDRVFTSPGSLNASFEVNYVHPDVRKILFPSPEEPPHTVDMLVEAERLVIPPNTPQQPTRARTGHRYHQAMRTWHRARKNFKAHGPQPYLAGYKVRLPAVAVTSLSKIPGGYVIEGRALHKGAEPPSTYQFNNPEEF